MGYLGDFLFSPQKHFKQHISIEALPGTLGLDLLGWMNAELFSKVMFDFINLSDSMNKKLSLLIFPTMTSHNQDCVLSIENGI